MKRLSFEECPKTRVEFIKKWNADRVFRARAQFTGFDILFGENVIMPNGKIAGVKVK